MTAKLFILLLLVLLGQSARLPKKPLRPLPQQFIVFPDKNGVYQISEEHMALLTPGIYRVESPSNAMGQLIFNYDAARQNYTKEEICKFPPSSITTDHDLSGQCLAACVG
nr:uncharacterized protein LOC116650695 [Drosophila virilis]